MQQEKLAATSDTVLEIALDSCFASHEGFSRAFKHLFCASPQEKCNIRDGKGHHTKLLLA